MSIFVHLARRVSNMEQSVKWYCDNFGFVVMNKHDRPDLQIVNIELPKNHVYVELICAPDFDLSGPKTYTHFALGVPDVAASCEKLVSAGLTIRKPVDWRELAASSDLRSCFIDDPDGYSIELLDLSTLPAHFSGTNV